LHERPTAEVGIRVQTSSRISTMGCLPESGGDERPLVEPFLRFLNHNEGSRFVHTVSCDQVVRDRPQPEVLCSDQKSGARLAVERKTIVWPTDTVECHKSSHALTHRISHGLEALSAKGAFVFEADLRVARTPREAESLAREVVERVTSAWDRLDPEDEFIVVGRHGAWRFSPRDSFDREPEDPDTGILFRFRVMPQMNAYLQVEDLEGLRIEVARHIARCARKFEEYSDARCVLLLDPFGDIEWYGAEWWNTFMRESQGGPPPWEVWLAKRAHWWDFLEEESWMFERVLPTIGPRGEA
jgi:hypothetical protein